MTELLINLQLFADGGDGASAGDGAVAGVDAVSQTATESVDSQSSPDTEDRTTAYNKFKSDYKAEYDADVQNIIKDRLKRSNAKTTELSNKLKSLAPVLEHIASKYGVDVNDTDALLDAFNNDDSIYEDEAYEKNMTVEQVKKFHEIERENASLREQEEERRKQAQFADWDRQAAELKQIYPSFDFGEELESDAFRQLMNAGVPIRTAYEVAHRDEIMQGAMQFSVQKATEKVVNSITANKARPSENGLSGKSASVSQSNINALSKEQMNDLKRRAASGERITFK